MSQKVHKVYKVEGMHCSSCAMSIEWDLEDAGLKAKCSYAKSLLEVEFEPEKVKEEKIKEVVEKSGYKLVL